MNVLYYGANLFAKRRMETAEGLVKIRTAVSISRRELKWYTKAAEQGDADAQYGLGALYALGDGAPRDLIQSYKWTNITAAQSHSAAEERRDALKPQMSPEQIAEAQRLSSEFWEKL